MSVRTAGVLTFVFALSLLAGCSEDSRPPSGVVGFGPPLIMAFLSERPPSTPFTTNIYVYDLSRSAPPAMPPNVNTQSIEGPCALSADGRWLAFFSDRVPTATVAQMFLYEMATGVTTIPPLTGALVSPQNPSLSGDGRYLATQYQVSGPFDLYVAMEDLRDGGLLPLPTLNEPNAATIDPSLSADGTLMAVSSNRFVSQGAFDIFLYSVPADSFIPLPGLNSTANDMAPSISADGRFIAFQSGRLGGVGLIDVYLYDRQIQSLVPLPGANTALSDFLPALSPDGRYLAFTTESSGGRDVRVYDIHTRRVLDLPLLNDPYFFDSFPSLASATGTWP